MKFYLVVVVVCVLFIPEKAYAALPENCPNTGQCLTPFTSCPAVGQPCQCISGYHLNPTSTACNPDVQFGGACTIQGNDTECVVNTICISVAGTPQCACKSGFHNTSGACVADIQPGSACTKENSDVECVNNAMCTSVAAGQTTIQCKCNAGFHPMSSACAADLQPGVTCTQVDVDTECVDNAICKNVNATGQNLKCACKSGFHVMSGACNADVQFGGACTIPGNDTECVVNTICISVAGTSQCACKSGFHNTSGACVADIQPGSACTQMGECVDNASCTNVTTGGLQCTCNSGFHVMSDVCAADIGAGETCTMANQNTECVDHATCKTSSQSANQTTSLCTCDENYHQVDNGTGKKTCAADTCQHTVDKCKAAGKSTCPEIVTFLECLLTGVCTPSDAHRLNVTRNVTIPNDCAITNKTTCPQKVSSCLIDHMKEGMNCTTIGTLETCLTGNQASCSQGEDVQVMALANAYKDYMAASYSCRCIQPIETCLAAASPTLDNVNATATDKCNAVSDLFKCVMPIECNVSKALDNTAVSGLWSKAMKGATDNQCKDTITEAAANTCSLQLARCSLIYGQERHNTIIKLNLCRAAEVFGKCLKEKTAQCTTNHTATKKVFTDQYALASANCMCENDINVCLDRTGVIPTDPAVACNKTRILGVCLMEAKCDMTQMQDNAFYVAFQTYKTKTAAYSCTPPTDNSCFSRVTACSHEFLTSLTKNDLSGTNICKASKNATLCVNAANCSMNVEADANVVRSVTNGTVFKMNTLRCEAHTCTKGNKDFVDCMVAYAAAFKNAGADNKKKCTANNNMVTCLRVPWCNHYLKGFIQTEYLKLQNITIEGCQLLPLEEPQSGAPSSRATLLPALASLLIGYFVVRM